MRIRPCIDLHRGRVKQIVGGSIRDGQAVIENFVSQKGAVDYACLYKEKGLFGGHIILLDSAASDPEAYNADKAQALKALSAFPGGMQVGGGIDPENASDFLDAGASHVIVTSYVFRDGMLDEKRLEKMISAVGKKRLVLDLSCKKTPEGAFVVVTNRWQRETSLKVTQKQLEKLSLSCDEFLIHAADVEGKRSGIQEELAGILGDFCKKSGFPVTYAGGVHAYTDLARAAALSGGTLDVTVGSALSIFGGDLDLDLLSSQALRLSHPGPQ